MRTLNMLPLSKQLFSLYIVILCGCSVPPKTEASWNNHQHKISAPWSTVQDPLAAVLSPLSRRYSNSSSKDILEGGAPLSSRSRQTVSGMSPRRDPYVATVFSNSSSVWMPRLAEESDPQQLNLTRANL